MQNIYIFLGAGGVGKTTLCAAFALSKANLGNHVILLSIDPAKRLQSALGISETQEETLVPSTNPNYGSLLVVTLDVEKSLFRWVEDSGMERAERERLFANPFYKALSQKMASAHDTLAAVRIAELAEKYPTTQYFIIDTAPGIHALDFMTKPDKLSVFLDSKIIDWFKFLHFSKDKNYSSKRNIFSNLITSSMQKIFEGLSQIGGKNFLYGFGEFMTLLDQVFLTARKRLAFSKTLILNSHTRFMYVCAVRYDSLGVCQELYQILNSLNFKNHTFILNRILPDSFHDPLFLTKFLNSPENKNVSVKLLVQFISSYTHMEKSIRQDLIKICQNYIALPLQEDLDGNSCARINGLSFIGDFISQKLIENYV